jgi:hypothetical protein
MTVLDKVIEVSKPYLGPAAIQFIERQCKSHLKTEPSLLAATQLQDLSKRVEISAGLIMDAGKAAELARKIAALR